MPQYTLEDAVTKRRLVVEGDAPPTEAEIADLFKQAESDPGISDRWAREELRFSRGVGGKPIPRSSEERAAQNAESEMALYTKTLPEKSTEEKVKEETWKELSATDKLAADAIELERGFKGTIAGAPKGAAIIQESLPPHWNKAIPTAQEYAEMQAWKAKRDAMTGTERQAALESNPLYQTGARLAASAPETPKPQTAMRPLGSALQGLGSVSASLTAAPLGPGAVTAQAYLMELSDAYESEIERQKRSKEPIDPSKAEAKAQVYAAGAVPLEYVGGAVRLARRWFGKAAAEEVKRIAEKEGAAAVTEFFKERIKDSAAEGGTEALQRFYQDAIVEGKPSIANALAEGASAFGGTLILGTGVGGIRQAGKMANRDGTASAPTAPTQPAAPTPSPVQPQAPAPQPAAAPAASVTSELAKEIEAQLKANQVPAKPVEQKQEQPKADDGKAELEQNMIDLADTMAAIKQDILNRQMDSATTQKDTNETQRQGRQEVLTPTPEATKPTGEDLSDLSAALNRYEDTGEISTVSELVDEVDSLIGEERAPQSLQSAVDAYREARQEDRTEYGERGDADAYENDFLTAVRQAIGKPEQTQRPAVEQKPQAKPQQPDYDRIALEQEGVTPTNVEALLNGTKTAQQVVDEQLGYNPKTGDADTLIVDENSDGSRDIGFAPPAGPASSRPRNVGQMSHTDAIEMARQQGAQRINKILAGRKQVTKPAITPEAVDAEMGKREATHPATSREVIDTNEDTNIGVNAAGEQLYKRKNGDVYRMLFDRPNTRPNGYPDFGGDLAPVGKRKKASPASNEKAVRDLYENQDPTQKELDALTAKLTDAEKVRYADALGSVARRIDKAGDTSARNARMAQEDTGVDLGHPAEESITTTEPGVKVEPEPQSGTLEEVEPESSAKSQIEDFGEKIEGARKDVWQTYKDRLNAEFPTDPEQITLSKVFPEPDYELAMKNGVNEASLATFKAVRDMIPPKPRVPWKLSRWTDLVKSLHGLMQQLARGELAVSDERIFELSQKMGGKLSAKVRLYRDLGYPLFTKASDWGISSGEVYEWTKQGGHSGSRWQTFATTKSRDFTTLKVDGTGPEAEAKVVEMIRQKLLAEQDKKQSEGVKFTIYQDRFTKEIFIGKKGVAGVVRLKAGFKKLSEARQYLADNQASLEEQWNGLKIKPDYRKQVNAPRQGPERRTADVTPEMFQDAFGFRGVQFGNWVESERRQTDLNEAFDALMDMAEILGVPPKAMSLNGTLGLAFGARGTGGRESAAAHYEPGKVVINLTKEAGPGSLAHEWFHAFDNYFARMDRTGVADAKPSSAFATESKTPREKNIRPEVFKAFKGIYAAISSGEFAARSIELDQTRSKPYYSTPVEKAARAFERYLVDRLAGREISNDYLVNLGKDDSPALPTQAEMENGIRQAYDSLFNTIAVVGEDPIDAKLSEWIEKTKLKPGALYEGVTGAPVWLTKTLLNGALRVARAAYRAGKSIADSVAEAVDWLRYQNIEGFNEKEAADFLTAEIEQRRQARSEAAKDAAKEKRNQQLPEAQEVANANWRQRAINAKSGPKPYTKGHIARWFESLIHGDALPKQMREARQWGMNFQKYIEESISLLKQDARRALHEEFKTKGARAAAEARLLAYWTSEGELTDVGGPALQRAAEAFRQTIDQLTEVAVTNGLVPEQLADTWLENRGAWLKRTYLAFDPTADWNYDTLKRRAAAGDKEIRRIWSGIVSYLTKQNPKMTPAELEAVMRSLIDRREVEDLLGIGTTGQPGSGKRYAVDTGSLIRRKKLPVEVREWMGQIKDPFALGSQSGKWMAQFITRNLVQRKFARLGLELGILSDTALGREWVELYPNQERPSFRKDEQGNLIPAEDGGYVADFRKAVDRRHEPLHGFYTSPEFQAALADYDAVANASRSAMANFADEFFKLYLGTVGYFKLAKVGLNPYSYGVNTIGGMVTRMMAGAVNPVHFRDAYAALLVGSKDLGENPTPAQERARKIYLQAVKAGVTGKGILLGDVRANLNRAGNPSGFWDAAKKGARLKGGEALEALRNMPAYQALLEVLEDPKGEGSWVRLKEATTDLVGAMGNVGIRFMDDVYRISAFLDEIALAKEAHPNMTEQEQMEWAADRALNIYQNYDRIYPIMRQASRVGILNTFVTFKFEFFRNAYWIGRYAAQGIKSDNPALRKDGYKKAVGLLATAAAPYALAVLSRALTDTDDDDVERLKRWSVPPWDRGEELVVLSHNGAKWRYVPMGYLLPSYELTRAFNLGYRSLNDPNPDLAVAKALKGMAADYFGPGGVAGPAIEAVSNKRLSGGPITYAEGTRGMMERAGYLMRQWRPNIGDPLMQAYMGATGQEGTYGRQYDATEVGLKLGGIRTRTVDVEKQVPFVMREFSERWRNSVTYANVAKRRYPTDTEKQNEAKAYAEGVQSDLKRQYKAFYQDMIKIGVTPGAFLKAEKEATLPTKLRYSRASQSEDD